MRGLAWADVLTVVGNQAEGQSCERVENDERAVVGRDLRVQRPGQVRGRGHVRHVKIDMDSARVRVGDLGAKERVAGRREQRHELVLITPPGGGTRAGRLEPERLGFVARRRRCVQEGGDPLDRHRTILTQTDDGPWLADRAVSGRRPVGALPARSRTFFRPAPRCAAGPAMPEGDHPKNPGIRLRDNTCTNRWPCCTVKLMATMNISAARESLPDAVELARTEAVFLERYGRPAAVLVSPEQYEKLVAALEDAEDVAAFDAAMNEEGPNIPWDQVKADLGWT